MNGMYPKNKLFDNEKIIGYQSSKITSFLILKIRHFTSDPSVYHVHMHIMI